jgi:putative ABC transport system substrate-binding protein
VLVYSADRVHQFKRSAVYVDKILRGAKPGDLPIEQPTQFKLVLNLRTADALGIKVPESIQVLADESIR